jgi:ABC-type Zn uptake system ZnuABC Zn-binding protein ZnuA
MLKRFFLLLVAVLFVGCSQKAEKKELSASIFPLKWLVENIYPDYEVYQIIKPGSNPHLYDLTPRDAEHIAKSQKVFLIGNLEPFAGKIEKSKRVEAIKILGIRPEENPHIWLSPKRWLELAEKLPENVKDLKGNTQNWKKVVSELQKLDKEYQQLSFLGLKVVMIHPAFVWLCKDYNLEILYILEKHGEGAEASLKRFQELVNLLKNEDLSKVVIFYTSVNPKAEEVINKIKTIYPELKTVKLDPLIWHTEGDYIKLMEENLRRILKALKG